MHHRVRLRLHLRNFLGTILICHFPPADDLYSRLLTLLESCPLLNT